MQVITTNAMQTSSGSGAKSTVSGLNWLGLTMFALLMIYPFIVNFIPQGIRTYLSTSVR
jgi:hypothetical protein